MFRPRFRPRCKSMKGEVKLESLDQRSSSRSVSLILSVSVSDPFRVQSLSLWL